MYATFLLLHISQVYRRITFHTSRMESDGTTESEMMKYYNGPIRFHCPISYPVDASRYLGICHVARLDDIGVNLSK